MKPDFTKAIIRLAALGCFLSPTLGHAKEAQCVIENEGQTFEGPCNFRAEKGGSFTITPIDPAWPFFDAYASITVQVTAPGYAQEVRSLSADPSPSNSRWGDARRSTSNKACWVGRGFKICVN
jgi:hypothetical protein